MKKIKRPRKIKKKIKKSGTLLYDIAGLPHNTTMMNIVNGFHNMGVVLWCSDPSYNFSAKKVDNPPTVVNGVKKINIVDVSKINNIESE